MLMRHAIQSNPSKLYIDDIFSTYLYTGNGTSQTITNGIDLAGEGGLVWIKGRNVAWHNTIFDTERGITGQLVTNNMQNADTSVGLSSYNIDGITLSSNMFINTNTDTYVSWVFRKAPKFFDLATITKSSGSDATVSFPNLTTLGMVIVKRTDSTGSWYVWHRSLTAGKLLYLEQTAAEATLGHITVSGTTVTLENGVIADGTYIVYAYAHDTSTDGLIQCGSFTTDSSGNATVDLGWEPQYILNKWAVGSEGWKIFDSMRLIPTGGLDSLIFANLSNAETNSTDTVDITATGFKHKDAGATTTYIYLAIRRPNKPPTTGTQVYNAIARTGTGAAATITGVGFSPDLAICSCRSGVASPTGNCIFDRLRGLNHYIGTDSSTSEDNVQTDMLIGWDNMTGVKIGADANTSKLNWTSTAYINHFFKRAPGFFDQICYTGTGVARTVNHNLGAVPELMIVKSRSNTSDWGVYFGDNTDAIRLNLTAAAIDENNYWNDTTPTTSVFTVGVNSDVNSSGYTYVAYLFSSLTGISKIGSYTGNGTTLDIDMGFSSGCRFFLVKRTDDTGDWFVWDTVRGIVSASDPHLSLNTTAAEVTTDDSVDPYAAGVSIIQNSATNINVTSATYIYMAIA